MRLIHGWHALAANAILIVAGLHAAAALFHHFILRDATLRRMLPLGNPLTERQSLTSSRVRFAGGARWRGRARSGAGRGRNCLRPRDVRNPGAPRKGQAVTPPGPA